MCFINFHHISWYIMIYHDIVLMFTRFCSIVLYWHILTYFDIVSQCLTCFAQDWNMLTHIEAICELKGHPVQVLVQYFKAMSDSSQQHAETPPAASIKRALILSSCSVENAKNEILSGGGRAFVQTLPWMCDLHQDSPETMKLIQRVDDVMVEVPWFILICLYWQMLVTFWIFLNMVDKVWYCLFLLEHVWIRLNMFEYVWIY